MSESRPTVSAATAAVNDFEIDAMRNGVSTRTRSPPPSAQTPSAANEVRPRIERAAATPGTRVRPWASRTASSRENADFIGNQLPYPPTQSWLVRFFLAAGGVSGDSDKR